MAKTKKVKTHVILHNGVGPFVAGEVVRADAWPKGVDEARLQQLVEQGAIAPGEDVDMPDEQDMTQGGTIDPLRTENPPTLPAEGVPDSTTPIGGDVSGQPEAMDEKAVKRAARG